jgi:hypothetical protein
MSTAEAIRIGTATTGRLITAAALILAVVAGSFVFSDLVLMKYLAFGLMAALLLDATIVRMFLVPSVMKLLGDDCWWAPRWARRLQNRIGLGEIDLPDERKRPTIDGRPTRPPVGAGLAAATPRPPHDPTHPGALEAARPRPVGSQEVRAAPELAVPSGSAPNTERIQSRQPTQAKTTRLAAPGAQAAPGRERPPVPTPSSGQTRAMPIPTDADDSDPATEQLNAPGQSDNGDRRRRGGGGLSAQDLLRREGRL